MKLEDLSQAFEAFTKGDGLWLLLVLFVAGLVGWSLNSAYFKARSRRRWRQKGMKTAAGKGKVERFPRHQPAPDMADPGQQLEAVSRVNFEKKRLLNRSEYRVLILLEGVVREIDKGHRVMAQTSLGELIQPRLNAGTEADRKNAFASVNSKRLDFAIVDKFGMLAVAVEFQGSGHYHQKTFMRDAVKREALRRAGVPFVEIEKNHTDADIQSRARGLLSGSGSA